MSDEVCKGICHYHEDRDKLMKEIADTTNQHKGYWKVLLLILAFALTSMFYMTSDIKKSVKSISCDVSELKVVVSNGVIDHNYNEIRLDNQRERMMEIDDRVRDIEVQDGRD